MKITLLCTAVFFNFTGDFCSMSSLKFNGIGSSHVGSLYLTFWFNIREKFLSSSVILFHVLFYTLIKHPLNLICSPVSMVPPLASFWRCAIFLGISSYENSSSSLTIWLNLFFSFLSLDFSAYFSLPFPYR